MCSFSRRVNLAKGDSYAGKLGRNGVSGPGLNPKHLQKVPAEKYDGPSVRTADLVSEVSAKERDKISAITEKIKREAPGSKAQSGPGQAQVDPSSFYPDFSYQPRTYENRHKPLNASFQRKPKKEDGTEKDEGMQQILLGVIIAAIVFIGGVSQLGSCSEVRDNLRTIAPARSVPTPRVPTSILEY